MASEADKLWQEMTGGTSASNRAPAATAPTASAPAASATTGSPTTGPASRPAIPAAAIYAVAAVIVAIAALAIVFILVNRRPAASPAPVSATSTSTQPTDASAPRPAVPADRAGKINLNTATAAQLRTLPGIGPSLADRIIAHRQQHGRFATLADLDRVSGIGPKTLEALRPLVYVD